MRLLILITAIPVAVAQPKQDIVTEVAIIGGGIAGISAAKALEEGGVSDWVLIEAQNRLGGRMKTIYREDLDTKIDTGSKWIQGLQRNPYYDLTQQCNVQSDSVNYANTVVYDTTDGTGLDAQLGEKSLRWPDFERGWSCIQDYGDSLNVEYDESGTVIDPIPNGREIFTACNWVPNTPADRAIEWFDLEYEYGYNCKEMSIYAFPEYTYFDFQDGDRIVTDDDGVEKSIGCLLDSFSTSTDDRIHLETEVRKILTDSNKPCPEGLNDDCVEIKLADGRSVFANYALSTLPFGVLKENHKTLLPHGFPGEDVLDKFTMAAYCKSFLKFKNKFWDDTEFILSTKDVIDPDEFNPIVAYKPYDTSHPNNYKPGSLVLQATIGGQDALAFENMSDEEQKQFHLQRLSELYPGMFDEDDLVGVYVARWSLDPHAYGTWFQYGLEGSPEDYDTLIKPVGNLMFGGEHTCQRFYGFIHGGMLAGMRDGQRLLQKLGKEYELETRCEELPPNQGFSAPPKSKIFK